MRRVIWTGDPSGLIARPMRPDLTLSGRWTAEQVLTWLSQGPYEHYTRRPISKEKWETMRQKVAPDLEASGLPALGAQPPHEGPAVRAALEALGIKLSEPTEGSLSPAAGDQWVVCTMKEDGSLRFTFMQFTDEPLPPDPGQRPPTIATSGSGESA